MPKIALLGVVTAAPWPPCKAQMQTSKHRLVEMGELEKLEDQQDHSKVLDQVRGRGHSTVL